MKDLKATVLQFSDPYHKSLTKNLQVTLSRTLYRTYQLVKVMKMVSKTWYPNKERTKGNIYSNDYPDTIQSLSIITELLRTIFQWKKSVWKLIWHHVLLYFVIYSILSGLYHAMRVLSKQYPEASSFVTIKETFELFCIYCSKFQEVIPVTLLVGFYVKQVVERWWDQYMLLPYPDHIALKLVGCVDIVKGHVSLHFLFWLIPLIAWPSCLQQDRAKP